MSAYTGISYNYTGVATGETAYMSEVNVSRVRPISSPEFVNMNPEVYSAFVDFEIQSVREPHHY